MEYIAMILLVIRLFHKKIKILVSAKTFLKSSDFEYSEFLEFLMIFLKVL